jgi:hypothetical protein
MSVDFGENLEPIEIKSKSELTDFLVSSNLVKSVKAAQTLLLITAMIIFFIAGVLFYSKVVNANKVDESQLADLQQSFFFQKLSAEEQDQILNMTN